MNIYKELAKAAGIGVIIYLVLLFGVWGGRFEWSYLYLIQFLYVVVGYSMSLYMANKLVFVWLDRKYGPAGLRPKRLIAGFLMSFAVSLFIIFLLRIFEDVVIEGETFIKFFEEEKIENYYVATIITLTISLLGHAIAFYKRYQENRVKEQKIIAGTASAKFETLKNQIDPHFLFNSLNVLSSLIEENPDSAQRFTTSLSKVYRYVLEQKDKELVSIQEELDFAKTYMNLLKMRFENSVFYELPATISSADARVVPLSLQLLLENTVKHNIVSQQKPLYIRIFEQDGYLVVQNDYQKKEVLQDRKGVGLQNIVSRYAIITARKVLIEQTEQHFTVKLPVLTKQVTIMETSYNETESSYLKAQKKVEDIKGFYGNLMSYVIVITGLAVLNLVTSAEHLWFLYPAIGWGIGVVIHFCSVFNYIPFLGRDWEERKLNELMERERSSKWK
ncbi:2TM domain-containing protein [Flavobacterium sp. MFBS3-15]|uniref:2TM domain-containing protein n=1 Tax=Flavobacterium sp. MFBS3-15 TaxID=2989816 RepID=UPI00223687DA|nr:2TM domain-containing protein [Flavobacterium sp. MFBS3-15]MCW4470571.1 2TM domain-containing protein [Flavobacterium sp. MFBS3-15]